MLDICKETKDIYMRRGDTETIKVECEDVNEKPIPFEDGDKVVFTVKSHAYTYIEVIQKEVTDFTPDGKAIITILPEDTSDLKFREYTYDIQVVSRGGGIITIVPDNPRDRLPKFVLKEEITT